MWIDHRKATTGGEILARHVLKQRGLADSGLADCIDVREAVGLLDAEGLKLPTEGRLAEVRESVAGVAHLRIVPRRTRRCRASKSHTLTVKQRPARTCTQNSGKLGFG